LAEYRRWQDAAGGRIGIITLAPELPGALEFSEQTTAEGVVIAIGHTAASAEQIRAAVDAGARLSTHLGNGAHAQIARHPNYIWEQLAEDRLAASLIFDGHHLPPAVMRSALRAKGVEQAILVSDVVAVGGLPAGTYKVAGSEKVELLPNGRLVLQGTPYLAGATCLLPQGIANAVTFAGVTLREAIRLATANPARLLSIDGPTGRGSVRAGAAADLTVFRFDESAGNLTIESTIVGGEVVYRAGVR
jgi:N-acetylglucosamine-6-phosphate deacetylase